MTLESDKILAPRLILRLDLRSVLVLISAFVLIPPSRSSAYLAYLPVQSLVSSAQGPRASTLPEHLVLVLGFKSRPCRRPRTQLLFSEYIVLVLDDLSSCYCPTFLHCLYVSYGLAIVHAASACPIRLCYGPHILPMPPRDSNVDQVTTGRYLAQESLRLLPRFDLHLDPRSRLDTLVLAFASACLQRFRSRLNPPLRPGPRRSLQPTR